MNRKRVLNKVNAYIERVITALEEKDIPRLKFYTRMLFQTAMIETTFKRYYPEFYKEWGNFVVKWDDEIRGMCDE